MAYNTKYILNYCNRDGDKLTIELQVDEYVGQAFIIVNNEDYLQDDRGRFITVNVDGTYDPERDKNKIEGSANPFSLTFRNDRGEKGGAIRATSATMEFYEDMLFNIDDLATSNETELRCVFKYNDKIEWIGFVTPDFFNVAIESNPVISLTASDRLGILKDVDYPVDTLITDKVSQLSILVKCLYETSLDLPINIVCDLYCDQFVSEDINPLAGSFVSEWRAIKDIEKGDLEKCYTIIQGILDEFNCLLTQYNGEWWVVNKYNHEIGGGTLWRYGYTGNFISKSNVTFGETFFNEIDTGGERTVIPAGAKNTYLLNNGPDMIYPYNFTFSSDTNEVDNIDYWTVNPDVPLQTSLSNFEPTLYNDNGNVSYDVERSFYRPLVSNYRIINLSDDSENFPPIPNTVNIDDWIIQSEDFKVITYNGEKSSFTLNISAVGKPNTGLNIGLFMKIKNSAGVESLFSLSPDVNSDPRGTIWKQQFSNDYYFWPVNTSTTDVIPVVFPDKYRSGQVSADIVLEQTINIAPGSDQDYDMKTAIFFVRLYPNVAYKKSGWNDGLINITSFIKNLTISFNNDNQVPKGVVFQTMLQERFTKPTDRRNIMWGDFQTFGQNGYFYPYREDSLSIIYNQEGQMTKDWYTPWDDTRQPLLLHSLRQFTKSYARAHDELRIGFDLNRINPFNRFAIRCVSEKYILVNENNDYLQDNKNRYITANIGKYLNNKRFILVEGTIDYLRSSFTGVLAEIVNTERETKEYIYSYFEDSNIK
ncbi:hypothetical protein HX021_08355 [Sphingobacterium sp. N143]|uniref:hypothetical protein n=1 Tax=Sphingobacterium sp. N143 TaxID=2746727 RepID=UPI0025753B68|nr:hypothetical protein [Sphingobacterium sp. N143]MDM1294309.1 hypothetical protein [Sphingobacterium sp. N143]